jgi:glucose/arabinose dehydrogenase
MGELFWKLTHGRDDMPAFEKILTEEQRWQVVSYIRDIPDSAQIKSPVSLREGISVSHYMQVEPQAVRILLHPVTNEIWYTTFNGNVYRVQPDSTGNPGSELVCTVKDHGIEVLQGAVFLDQSLFLCGNVYSSDKKTTHGRMVRFNPALPVDRQVTVVFNTVDYAANKTIYDHGWNALAVSPDKKYIFANSGARTDHGEVQDNGGAYPGARDNALTSKIFRFPVTAENLLLPDDTAKLRADGYLYAQGVRNAYDLNFDADGRLFAVSNSADYDYPEDMFWIRQDHHYGFPWIMGGLDNPQQYRDWKPDADHDPFINTSSHAWRTKYYYNDSTFPARPAVKFTPGMLNLGPDANEYRGHSGKIEDGDRTGVAISTFTAHCSPLGLFFDTRKVLAGDLKGSGFVIRYTSGERSSLMKPFTKEGADLLHLRLSYDPMLDNYVVSTKRIVDGFRDPVDAVLYGNDVYVIEYGGRGGHIWKITLPAEKRSIQKR